MKRIHSHKRKSPVQKRFNSKIFNLNIPQTTCPICGQKYIKDNFSEECPMCRIYGKILTPENYPEVEKKKYEQLLLDE